MTAALVDDRLLAAVLRGPRPRALRRRPVATTGLWYARLCEAVLSAMDRPGRLPAPLARLDGEHRHRALAAIVHLPEEVELLSLRDLAPTCGRLRRRHALDPLGIEALAAAVTLGATIHLSAPAPELEAAAGAEGIEVRRAAT